MRVGFGQKGPAGGVGTGNGSDWALEGGKVSMRGREARVGRAERATGKQRAQRASPTMALVWGTERVRSRPLECNRPSTSLNLTLAERGETLFGGGGGRR